MQITAMGKKRQKKPRTKLFTMQASINTQKKKVHDYNFMLISIAVEYNTTKGRESLSENKPVPEKQKRIKWIEEKNR
jgi:hypothetical protein